MSIVPFRPTLADREQGWQAAWIMHDMCLNSLPRLDAFRELCALGYRPRSAAEIIQSHEREPNE